MPEFDYADLLERAREGLPRDELAPVMPFLTNVDDDFENPTKLRLLGNAIANNKANAAVLQSRPEAIQRLLSLKPLGLQILYNGCVENKEFSIALMNTPGFTDALEPSPHGRALVGSMYDAMDAPVSTDIAAQLAVNGFIEAILDDVQLETHPVVLKNFARIYAHCQRVTLAASESLDPEDGFASLGFQVVGNISAHRDFGLDEVRDVPAEPYTWDTVALLANLTAAKADLEAVFAKWPKLVPETVELIKEEDPETVKIEELDLGPQFKRYNEDQDDEDSLKDFGDDDDDEGGELAREQPPFDLSLWGSLFRNVARHPPAAKELAKHEPAKLVSRLLIVPLFQDIAWDFASTFSANCYDHDLVAFVTQSPFSGGSVLVCSSAVQGLLADSELSSEEVAWAVLRLVAAISEGLEETDQVAVWVKGTRALAMLKAAHPKLVNIDIERLKIGGPEAGAVQSNLAALKVTDKKDEQKDEQTD